MRASVTLSSDKTWNGSTESTRSAPTHSSPMELHQCELFVHSERFAHSFSRIHVWMGCTIIDKPAHTRTKCDARDSYIDDDNGNSVLQCIVII